MEPPLQPADPALKHQQLLSSRSGDTAAQPSNIDLGQAPHCKTKAGNHLHDCSFNCCNSALMHMNNIQQWHPPGKSGR
jgi:hypothetical protein